MSILFRDLIDETPESPPSAEPFEGIYQVKGRMDGPIITVEKLGEDKYSFNSDDCDGIGFWNKQANAYQGVYRYHDKVKFDGQEYARGGRFENGVGYHHIEPLVSGGYTVLWQWGLSAENGRGFFEIERVRPPDVG